MHRTTGLNFTKDSQARSIFQTGTVIEKNWLNSVQEEIAHVIEKADYVLPPAKQDTRDQLNNAINRLAANAYDVIITDQTQFNAIIERVAANQYKIKTIHRSLYVKYLSGGYQCSGATSFLSGGDTWGYIETNSCGEIFFEADTYLDFANTQGYLKANTTDGCLHNVDIRGTGTVASAIVRSFLLAANRVMFFNCKTSVRLSNTTFSGFEGSATALHNMTSKYIGCSAFTLDSTGIVQGFYKVQNLSECYVYDIASTATFARGYNECKNLSNCNAVKIDNAVADSAEGFYNSDRLSGCKAEDIDGVNAYGFYTCDILSSCYGFDIQGSTNTYGFANCNRLTSCHAQQLDGATVIGFNNCDQLSGCYCDDVDGTTGSTYGYYQCNELSACKAFDIASTGGAFGFGSCNNLSSCYIQQLDGTSVQAFGTCYQLSSCYCNDIDTTTGNAYGFIVCKQISACHANDIDSSGGNAYGFYSCNYGSSLNTIEPLNPGNDWIDTNDAQIANQFSCPACFT